MEIAPDNTVTLLYAAELASDSGDIDRATSLLKKILELPVDPEWEFENNRDKQIAHRMLEELG